MNLTVKEFARSDAPSCCIVASFDSVYELNDEL